jgi:hypothetical protein
VPTFWVGRHARDLQGYSECREPPLPLIFCHYSGSVNVPVARLHD